MEDTGIIELYIQRRETALAETAKKYGGYLNQVAYNILSSREDTEEVVSDTYLAAWNTIPPQRPRVLRHYLSRITRNLAFDRLDYRRAGKRNANLETLLSELEECIPDWKNDLELVMERKEIAGAINRFLSEQSKADCALFLNRYYYSMPIAALEKRHGLSEGAIKYRLSVLRKKLRQSLKREGIAV